MRPSLSVGATAIVARRTGEKNPEGAAHAGAQAITISVVLSVILGVVGMIFAGDILRLMGASPEVVTEGTTFARVLLGGSVAIVLLFLINGNFGFDMTVAKTLFTVAWPASLQFIIGSGSWIFLTRLVAESGGTAATAGYQIAFRNFIFFILPAWGLSNAAATLMGQNLGAKQFDRAEESVYVTAKFSAFMMVFVTAFLVIFAEPIIGVFTKEADVFNYGVEGLRLISSGFIFYGIGMVISQALNGAGDTKTPTRLNFLIFWVFQLPLAYYLVHHTGLKASGALLVIPIAHALLMVLAWLYFRKGNWRDVKV